MSSKLIFSVLALLSIILFIRLAIHFLSVRSYPEGKNITFETQVLTQPKISSRGAQVSLSLPNSQRVIVRFVLSPLISYGDKIKLEGKIEYFKAKNGDNVAFMNYPKFEILKKGEDNLLFSLRERIIYFFNSKLNPTHSALMLGIVFGIKEEMASQFYLNLQKTGLLHVIAASGMNVTMVGGFLASIFSFFFKRQLALIMSILGIFFYAFMAGLEPSIVRASIMGVLVFGSQIIGRQNMSFLGLFMAGFLMLFLNPSLLLDIGFQLSFMATLGLIFLQPAFFINKQARKMIQKSVIGEDLVTTLTAQIFTLPILLVNFGTYSIWSVLVNSILLWTIPFLMVIGGIASILGLLIEPLGRIFLYLALPFLLYFEAIVNWFGSNAQEINIGNLPISISIGYYLILASIIIRIKRR